MIVGSLFEGDDLRLALMQHDVYGDALRIIARTCRRYAMFAEIVATGEQQLSLPVERFDHRTLQGSHDLLAAVWRYRESRSRQLALFSKTRNGGSGVDASPEMEWLDWLQAEVASWIDRPDLVRAVETILANQNQPVGYLAESELQVGILKRFGEVPWEQRVRQGREDGLEASRRALGEVP